MPAVPPSEAAERGRGIGLHQLYQLLRPAHPHPKPPREPSDQQEEEKESRPESPQVHQAALVFPACRVLSAERSAAGCNGRRRGFGEEARGRSEPLRAVPGPRRGRSDAVFDHAPSADRPAHLETHRNSQVGIGNHQKGAPI